MNSINHTIDIKKTIYEDKNFVIKMVFLSLLILILSAYLILQSLNIVYDLSIFTNKKFTTSQISLRDFDNTFGELEELDLSKIELVQNNNTPKQIEKKVEQILKYDTTPIKEKTIDKKKIFIQTNEAASIKFLKKRFKATNTPAYSIMISKKYFEQKKYKQALKWALITNELDNNNEDSWILFAKSKVKLNQKKDAIDALSEYLRTYDSQRAESVLQQIIKTS